MNRQHAIYGLYLPDEPTVILYAGSWRVATLDERLRQHRDGECKTTVKMAARGGVDTGNLRMRVLAYWMSGVDPNPEGEVLLGLQAQGWCRWNHPHAFNTEDQARGGRNGGREGKALGGRRLSESGWHQTPEGREAHRRAGRIGGPIGIAMMSHEDHVRGGHKLKESGWHETPEAHEAHIRGGRNGNREVKARGGDVNWWGWAGMTPEQRTERSRHANAQLTPEKHQDNGRKGGFISGRLNACTRWHADRLKVNRLCAECAAKTAPIVPPSSH